MKLFNMEINKQLFEDVLSGKLKGMFVLRDGTKMPSCKLESNSEFLYFLAGGIIVYCDGRYSRYTETFLDIVDFIPNTDMKENELTIEIPKGKTVDWEASQKQNKIIFKEDEKLLIYEDVCDKLFDGTDFFFIASDGEIDTGQACGFTPNCAKTKHQLECILAKNKLTNVAVYLNNGWKPDKCSDIYYINNYHGNLVVYLNKETCSVYVGQVIFKTKELAEKAIKILGEETVKLALEPLGI